LFVQASKRGERQQQNLVGEARRAGMIGQEEAANLIHIHNIRQKGTPTAELAVVSLPL
jgi:hypothetical protein